MTAQTSLYISLLTLTAVIILGLLVLWRTRTKSEPAPPVDQVAADKVYEQTLIGISTKADDILKGLREELATNRKEVSEGAAQLRTETSAALGALREAVETTKDNIANSFANLREGVDNKLTLASQSQFKQLDEFSQRLGAFGTATDQRQERFRETIDSIAKELRKELADLAKSNLEQQTQLRARLQTDMERLRSENDTKLEQIRGTVDERLQKTLEQRLGESFKLVSERLEQVHAGLGEMQALASNVGDLKKVLGNIKTRGAFGEVQLQALIEDILTPEQYIANANVQLGTGERVEFAVRMPGRDQEVLIPVDSKFPMETYENLLNQYDSGNQEQIRRAKDILSRAIRGYAKTISKYINPPFTTDFAVMFLPTEGLFSEVLREPGFANEIRHKYKIAIVGPTNFSAFLLSLQVGFRTLAIERRSSEVWQLLGGVKTEFGKFGDILIKVKGRLEKAQDDIGEVERRTRVINHRLRDVEGLPEAESTAILGATPAEIALDSEPPEEKPPFDATLADLTEKNGRPLTTVESMRFGDHDLA